MLTQTPARSSANHSGELSERIRRRTVDSIATAMEGGPRAIETRLQALSREWDAERALDLSAASSALLGLGLATRDRRWLVLPAIAAGFVLQHALRGYCPPLSLLRALGFRTRREIDRERTALKAARGDFDALDVASAAGPHTLLTVTEF